jgi:hypothetical protein
MPSFKDPNIESRLDSPPSAFTALSNRIKPCLCNGPGLITRAANLD